MKIRFLSEAAAYRFVLLTVAHVAAIDIAAHLGGATAALTVLGLLLLSLVVRVLRSRLEPSSPEQTGRRPADRRRWILVVVNETVEAERLRAEIERGGETFQGRVLVVCPALNSRLRHWVSDEDEARADARERLRATIDTLAEGGIDAHGEIADPSPLQAIADALWEFAADEIIIATRPPERSNWLERDVAARARRRFALPITHIRREPVARLAAPGRPEAARAGGGEAVVRSPSPAHESAHGLPSPAPAAGTQPLS